MRPTIKELCQRVNIVDVIGKHIPGGLKKVDKEHVGKCIFHDDHKASLKVNETKQIWSCFVCSHIKGGDAYSFLELIMSKEEAYKELEGGNGISHYTPEQIESKKKKQEYINSWQPILPAPGNSPNPPLSHYKHGPVTAAWPYVSENGEVNGWDCRVETEDGKLVLPLTYASDGKRFEWRWMAMGSDHRPLFGLNAVHRRPNNICLIVEGCKTAKAAQDYFGEMNVVTWQGGSNAPHLSDWTPLSGKTVVLFPDHDSPGRKTMMNIASILLDLGCKIFWVNVPENYPEKWDVADASWTVDEAVETVQGWVTEYIDPRKERQPEHLIASVEERPQQEFDATHDPYFRLLGYDTDLNNTGYWLYVKKNNTIIRKTASQLTKPTMFELAPQVYWEMNFKGKTKTAAFDQDMALNFLIQRSQEMGYFTEENIRGRGAWFDKGRTIVNVGNKLIVDGKEVHFKDIQGNYIYNQADPLELNFLDPLTVKECAPFIEMIKIINWEKESSPYLFAGWCAVAPICGALEWRPHIWITGASGSGKTWTMDNVVTPLLGKMAVKVQGATTEAGLRQEIRNSAVPVIFDEAEAEDLKRQQSIQEVLALARASSSKNSGNIVKGVSSGGTPQRYTVKSCFVLASIAVSVKQQADRNRFSILSLKASPENDKEVRARRRRSNEIMGRVINKNYNERLIARIISMIPVVLKSAEIFSDVCSTEFGSRRAGDQIGTQLAGYWALVDDLPVTREEALQLVASINWTEEKEDFNGKDEHRLVNHIMQSIIRIDGCMRSENRTLFEVVRIACGRETNHNIEKFIAEDTLARWGLKIDGDFLFFSGSNQNLKNLIKDTAWQENHTLILKRFKDARKERKRCGVSQETMVGIPVEHIITY